MTTTNDDDWKEEWKKKSEEDYESLLELIHEPTLKSLGQVGDMFLEVELSYISLAAMAFTF